MSIKQNGGVFGRGPTFNNVEVKSLIADTADINGGTIDDTVIGGSTPAAISGTTGTFSGQFTVDTNTLFVDAANNRVGVGTVSPDVFSRGDSVTLGIQGASTASLGLNAASGSLASIYIGQGGVRSGQIVGGVGFTTIVAAASNYLSLATNFIERLRIDSSGRVGIGVTSPTNLLDVNADSIRIRTAQTPATAGDTGNQGEIAWDADYIYVCVATNTWKRAALTTW